MPYIKKLVSLSKNGMPVFLTGDFNSPSHLDWSHHQPAVQWPVTKTIEQHGLIDAYRHMHPNTDKYSVATWPSGRPAAIHTFDGYNPSEKDLPDRIDFIFAGSHAKVIEAAIAGEPAYPFAAIKVWPWPSDHRAVIARFEIKPSPWGHTSTLQPAHAHDADLSPTPRITVNKPQFKPGDPITISWRHAPQNRYDYILIAPAGSQRTGWGEAVRLYTLGEANGSVVYDQHSMKGNWLAWHSASEAQWPLQPGAYEIKLMQDDSYTELARTQILIEPS